MMILSLFQGAAWQLIERLHRMNCPPKLHILQRVLYLCSRLKEEPAVASQVKENLINLLLVFFVFVFTYGGI